jgi:2'-5' RNA ligase
MRVFLAIDINNIEILHQIEKIQKVLISTEADLKPVNLKNLHITLKFFGEISESETIKIINKIKNLEFKAFNLDYKGIGFFPNENKISVIWIGIDTNGQNNLLSIIDKINNSLRDLTIGDDKSFSPHLTIFRLRNRKNKELLLKMIKQEKDLLFGKDYIKEIKLKKSELTPQGPIYSDLYTHNLKVD